MAHSLKSALLHNFVCTEYGLHPTDEATDIDNANVEQTYLNIQTDYDSNLISHNQQTNYWYQGETLSEFNFYEFACCIVLENKNKVRHSVGNDTRLSIYTRHALLNDHPLAKMHHLVEHTNEE